MIGLILAADLTTYRKTATYAPLAAFIVLAAYKRQILRWTPIAIIVLIPRHPLRLARSAGRRHRDLAELEQRRLHGRTRR